MMIQQMLIVFFFACGCYAQHDKLARGKLITKHFPEVWGLYHDFGVSGKHGDIRPDLWLIGASQTIPQLNQMIDFVAPGYKVNTLSVEESLVHFNYTANYKKLSLLANILNTCGSDKAVFYQSYHIVYTHIFEDLRQTKTRLRTLEIGMGTNKSTYVSTMGVTGKPGASLRAFSKYLPDADVFGADIDSEILFQSEVDRIRTAFVDGYNYSTYEALYEAFDSKRFDLIIDDAAHSMPSELNTLLFGLSHVNVPGWIVIEDLNPAAMRAFRVIDYLIKSRLQNKIDMWSSFVFTAHRRNGRDNPKPSSKSLIYVVKLQPIETIGK